jgi:hypothetical protein
MACGIVDHTREVKGFGGILPSAIDGDRKQNISDHFGFATFNFQVTIGTPARGQMA